MDEELEEMEQRPVARRRVVESRPVRGGLSLGTQFMLILGITLVVAVSIMIWVSQRTISPTVKHITDALGSYGWLWMLLLIVTAIGAAIGLLRRFGFIKFIEDVVVLGLRVHRHFVDASRLKADKIGNYEIPLDKNGQPIYIQPGNPAFAPQVPMMPSMGIGASRRAAKANAQVTQITEVDPQGPLSVPGTLPTLLNTGQSNVYDAHTVKLADSDFELVASSTWEDRYIRPVMPSTYNFFEELQGYAGGAAFLPSAQGIFMGRSQNGPILLPLKDMWHIMFTGPTGGGKSKIVRLLLSQLVMVGAHCYYSDKHYVPYDEDEGLDWTPIEERLAAPVMTDVESTYDFLNWLVGMWPEGSQLERRILRKRNNQPLGPPIFICIEELPAIIEKRPESAQLIKTLLQEGRKYNICFMGAAQGMLVKTIGLDSGARENVRTGYYTGGDIYSAKIILDLQEGDTVKDDGLGAGLVYVKTVRNRATKVRIPWPDNEAIQMLCSMSPLSVHEIVRPSMPESLLADSPYQPKEQEPTNIREFPVPASKVGRQPDPIKPEHLAYAGQHLELSDANLAKALEISQFQANKMKNAIKFVFQHPEMSDAEIAKEKSILEEDATLIKSLITSVQEPESVND